MDVFAWCENDMTGVPHHIAEHRLNVNLALKPVVQKRRGMAPNLVKWLCEEVTESRAETRGKFRRDGESQQLTVGAGISFLLHKLIPPKKTDPIALLVFSIPSVVLPRTVKEVQSLTGKLAALTRFLSKAAERQLPFFKTLKGCLKQKSFVWTSEAETAFQEMKKLLKTLPMLIVPVDGKILYLYISVANEAFGHPVHVLTNLPIKQVLTKPEISGRLALWAVELGAYEISYLPRSAVKSQVMADYLTEMSGELEVINEPTALKPVIGETSDLFTDCASCVEGAGAGLVLASPSGEEHTYALRFNFDVTNNEAQYEAMYIIQNDILYRKSYCRPMMRCVGPIEAEMIVEEVRNGTCALHSGYKTIAAKIMRMGPFPAGPGNVKFLIVAVDYFTKWVEAKAGRTITGVQVRNFVWECIVCRFGIPRELVSDNGAQIAKDPFKIWCTDLNIIQKFTSVAHPQANGLCEVTNRDIVSGIKKRLCEKRTGWVDELPNVLWAHHTTFKKSTGETLFSLVYASEAVIPAEILVPTHRFANFEEEANDAALSENLNFIEEQKLMAAIREANNIQKIAKYYNKRVRALSFDIGEWSLDSQVVEKAHFGRRNYYERNLYLKLTSSRSLIAVILARGISAMPYWATAYADFASSKEQRRSEMADGSGFGSGQLMTISSINSTLSRSLNAAVNVEKFLETGLELSIFLGNSGRCWRNLVKSSSAEALAARALSRSAVSFTTSSNSNLMVA
ncbi:uncharacterized protein [Rutidosis leptorrhynchoides]|uniref:uncharacterized protein n=1 Tax=Rutidosis leptorrhynchoides TaxID=125765 RepID=UPI003A99B111